MRPILVSFALALCISSSTPDAVADPAPPDAAITAPQAGSAQAGSAVVIGAGSSVVVVGVGSGIEPVPAPVPVIVAPPSVGEVETLWRSGAFLCAGIVALYLLLAFVVKVDPRYAFYASAGVAGLGTLIDAAAEGRTPNTQMLIAALAVVVGVITKGPGLSKGTPEQKRIVACANCGLDPSRPTTPPSSQAKAA